MSVIAHGVDMVECARIALILDRHRDRFLDRILTQRERLRAETMRDSLPHIAGRFAAKEAVLKVLGTGWRGGIAWTDIEVVNDPLGRPLVHLSGECADIGRRMGIATILLSISHTDACAIASAIALGSGRAAP